MPIKAGDSVPMATFMLLTPSGVVAIDTTALFKGRKVALFGVPGAYTPVCSTQHLPGFVEKADALKDKGFDEIACISVNDPFVTYAWGKSAGADGKVLMLADAEGVFTRAMGLVVSLPAFGLGERSKRYSMIVEDSVICKLDVETDVFDHGVSSAISMLGS